MSAHVVRYAEKCTGLRKKKKTTGKKLTKTKSSAISLLIGEGQTYSST